MELKLNDGSVIRLIGVKEKPERRHDAVEYLEKAIEDAYVANSIYKPGAIRVVVVPPPSVFYVRGFVYRPGELPFTSDLTLLKAVTKAGGPTEYAHSWRRVIRRDGV